MAIQTDKLTYDFGSLRAVDNLTIEVSAGTIYGFLGPNGAGKTTTINLLLGLLVPTIGNASVLGFDVRKQGDMIRGNVGALLEYTGLYEQLNAVDNLRFYGKIWKIAPIELDNRIKELLIHMRLWDRRTEKVVKWSKGMKQQLALARSLLHHPRLLFLDEPTAGLDVMAAAAIHTDLLSITEKEGMTIFLTTHNLAEAEKLCQDVAFINQGKLLAIGKPDELIRQSAIPGIEIISNKITSEGLDLLRNQPEISSVDIHDNIINLKLRKDIDTTKLIGLLVSHGIQIEEVYRKRVSLEEVLIKLVEEEK